MKDLTKLLENGIKTGAYPGYAAAVGNKDEIFFHGFYGSRCLYPENLPVTQDTLYDMASLTKLLGTTLAFLRMWDEGVADPDMQIGDFFENSFGKGHVTLFQLLTHTSGIAAHLPLYKEPVGRCPCEYILSSPFAYETGKRAVYSCMGFILLGKILEKIEKKPLDKIVSDRVFVPLGIKTACYNPPANSICAATEKDIFDGNIICGKVHDENARFLNGVSGNAGMFCTLDDTLRFAQMLSRRGEGFVSERVFELAVQDYTKEHSESRGLGFQLYGGKPFPGGSNMSLGSYGHTGFTGTSLYVDNKSGTYGILLTNRVHPTRENYGLMQIRKSFYDSIFSEV